MGDEASKKIFEEDDGDANELVNFSRMMSTRLGYGEEKFKLIPYKKS